MGDEKCAHPNCKCNTSEHQAATNTQYCSSYCATGDGQSSESCECGHSGCQHEAAAPNA